MELQELWNRVLGEVELQVSRPSFATWLKGSELIDKRDGVALVSLPSNFAKEWAESKFNKLLLSLLRNHADDTKRIEYVVRAKNLFVPGTGNALPSSQQAFAELRVDPETNLNPRYNMNSFVVGSSNEMAYAATSAALKEVGRKYNPLFLYGGVGVGKTHLVQAMGNELVRLHNAQMRVRYVPSEKFTNEVVWAMRNKRMDTIKERYRSVDVLIIDDIQFIGGKARTEEEFFHTFNALYEHNKQIVVSSDRSPRFLPTLSDRLRSRFEGGMTCDIGAPDYELRLAVLQTKLRERGAALDAHFLEFIAGRAPKNLRDLEGLLNRILFRIQAKQEIPTQRLIEQMVNESLESAPAHHLDPHQIIEAVATFFKISSQDITGRSRRKECIEPRQIAIYLLKELLNLSYVTIGEKIGSRDHTTAIYAHEKIAHEVSKSQAMNHRVMTIQETIMKG